MLTRFEPAIENASPASLPGDILPDDEVVRRYRMQLLRLKRMLTLAPELQGVDEALHSSGPHIHPSARIDDGKQDIKMLETMLQRLVSANPQLANTPELREALAKARLLRPVILDIDQIEETDPAMNPAAEEPHHLVTLQGSGIVNLTDHPLPMPDNVAAGKDIIVGLEHALGRTHATLVHKPKPETAAERLRQVTGKPDDEEADEDDLEAVLAAREHEADEPTPI